MNKSASLLALLIILAAAFAVFAFETNSYPLIGVDEPRYAESAREMLERKDLITPYCHYQPRYDKPVLYYWLEALSMTAFGFNEFAARLPSIIAGLGMIVLAYLLGSVQGYGLISAVIMATSLEIALASKLSITDITLCFFISATIAFFFLGYSNQDTYRRKFAFHRKTSSNWFIAMFVMAALGTLTKGPVAIILPLIIIIPFLIYEKELIRCFEDAKKEFLTGIISFLIITVPWYLMVHINTHGAFTQEFFFKHNLERYTNVVSHHSGPIWFYIPVVLIGFFPWTSVVIPAIKSAIEGRSSIRASSHLASSSLVKFSLWWAILVLGFFSIAGTKLPTYILPIYLPLSIITAAWWSESFNFERTKPWRNLPGLIGLGSTLVVLLIGLALVTNTFKSALADISPDSFTLAFLIIGFIFVAAFCIAMTAILREAEIAFITIAIATAICYTLAAPLFLKPYANYMDDGIKKLAESCQAKNQSPSDLQSSSKNQANLQQKAQNEQGPTLIYSLEGPLTNLFFYSKSKTPALSYKELKAKLNTDEAFRLVVKSSQQKALQTKLSTANGEALLNLEKIGKRFLIYSHKTARELWKANSKE